MRIHGFAMGVAGMVAVAASWLPAPVRACSCTPQALHKFAADPKDGAIDVPLNAAAVFSGAFQSGSVVVEDGAGQPVDVAITEAGLAGPCGGKWAEVVPKQPWAPHTTYRIRVTSSYPVGLKPGEDFLSFTTGDVSLPDPDLAMPKAHVSLMRDFPETSCGPTPVLACIDVGEYAPDPEDVEVIARRDGHVVLQAFTQGPDGTWELDAMPDCMEFRRRAPTGKRSKPLILCGTDLRASKYEDPGNLDWPSCRSGEFFRTKTDSTCTTEPGLPKNSAAAWMLGVGIVLAALNRRRRIRG